MEKEQLQITTKLLESEAQRLAKLGLPRYEVILKLTKQYGSAPVSEWLELDALTRTDANQTTDD